MKRHRIIYSFILFSILLFQGELSAQNRKSILHDTLDGKLDFSRFLLDKHGFIPVPMIITQPALGGFGGAITTLFLSRPKNIPEGSGYVAPDITSAVGGITVNGTWATGVGRIASFPKPGIKYRVGAAYADVNLAFYRDIANLGEKKFEFSIKTIPVFASISKRIFRPELYVGIQYLFLRSKVKPLFIENFPDTLKSIDLDNHTGTLGAFVNWDSRNTVFTPDKGVRANILFAADEEWTGSEYRYEKIYNLLNWFIPIRKNWICGLRYESNHIFGNPPFYLLPSINLRGIPLARYQGQNTFTLETEQRIDIRLRWSLVGFVGYGKAIEKDESFGEGKNVYSIGGGFRYLIARTFKIRTGIDIAAGPDSWGWYIVFGHNWNR